jgi:hypothetical protein
VYYAFHLVFLVNRERRVRLVGRLDFPPESSNMGRSNYSAGKRQREIDKERKRQDKLDRKRQRRAGGEGSGVDIVSADEIQRGSMMSVDEVVGALDSTASGPPTRSRSMPVRLFVGGLDRETSAEQLRARFEAVGAVADVILIKDRETGSSRGFGFVTMADRRDATEAIRRLNGSDLDGRILVVRPATERR